MLGVKFKPQKSVVFRAWMLLVLGVFRDACLRMLFVLGGLATKDRETHGFVNFVDNIEIFVDIQKTLGHKLKTIINIPCLGICICCASFRTSFFEWLGSF